jgi:sugar lactone lactonase YvrE
MTQDLFTKHFLYLITILSLTTHGSAQVISTFAGGGVASAGSSGPATSVQLVNPGKGIFDKNGNYYFEECLGGNRIRTVDPAGIIRTVAGTGTMGFSGDGGLATNAKLNAPGCSFVDKFGHLYICDGGNFRLRKVDAFTGIISTIAGNGTGSYTGDGIPATAAGMTVFDAAFDRHGNLYIADYGNARIRKISSSGLISTIAGNGIPSYSGDGSRADTSKIGGVSALIIDTFDNIFLADNSNSRILKITATGIITTIAGTGTGYLYNGDDIPATAANIDPYTIKFDNFGNLFIGEYHNYRVRRVDPTGTIYTVAGSGIAGITSDGVSATVAKLSYPSGISLDSCGTLYIPEADNNRIRKVTYPSCNYLTTNSPIPDAQFPELYPNPTTTQLHITLPNTTITTLTITNHLGQLMLQQVVTGKDMDIDVQRYPQGIYYVALSGSEGVEVRRFVKM